jgi:hypothetical protein
LANPFFSFSFSALLDLKKKNEKLPKTERLIIYGKNIYSRTFEEKAEIFNSGNKPMFSLWSQARIYARFRIVPYLLP